MHTQHAATIVRLDGSIREMQGVVQEKNQALHALAQELFASQETSTLLQQKVGNQEAMTTHLMSTLDTIRLNLQQVSASNHKIEILGARYESSLHDAKASFDHMYEPRVCMTCSSSCVCQRF